MYMTVYCVFDKTMVSNTVIPVKVITKLRINKWANYAVALSLCFTYLSGCFSEGLKAVENKANMCM